MKFWLILFFLIGLSSISLAHTDIVGKIGKNSGFSGRNSVSGGIGTGTPPPTGDILLVDGTSFILQTDGTSLICRAGGC